MQTNRFREWWKKRWVQHGLTVVVMVAVVAGVRGYQQRDLVIGVAPALDGVTLEQTDFALQNADRPTIVYFWATWCAVCRVQRSAVESLAADGHVISVAMQSGSRAEVARYLKENDLRAPTLNDSTGEQASNWGVRATPTFFVVDREGNIRFREVGYTTELGLRIRLWLAQ